MRFISIACIALVASACSTQPMTPEQQAQADKAATHQCSLGTNICVSKKAPAPAADQAHNANADTGTPATATK
jgi:hypothetical protein